MREVKIIRDGYRVDEVWTQGKLSALKITMGSIVEGNQVTVTDVWSIPEDEQMWAEDWYDQRRELLPSASKRAIEETNLEFQLISSIVDYINTLPAE